eukprot:1153210-Pelagomonas_calceolata.AAC.4
MPQQGSNEHKDPWHYWVPHTHTHTTPGVLGEGAPVLGPQGAERHCLGQRLPPNQLQMTAMMMLPVLKGCSETKGWYWLQGPCRCIRSAQRPRVALHAWQRVECPFSFHNGQMLSVQEESSKTEVSPACMVEGEGAFSPLLNGQMMCRSAQRPRVALIA